MYLAHGPVKNLADNENSQEENKEVSGPLEEVCSLHVRGKSNVGYDAQ